MTAYLLAGGGSAGHVNPLLAVADVIRRRDPSAVIRVLGTAEGLESRLVPARGFDLLVVDRLPFPRRPNRDLLAFPRRFSALVGRISDLLAKHEIDVVVGFGGYVSAPAYLAARRRGLPIVVHEANSRPGLANRLGSMLTRHVGIAFPGTRLRSARVVGMPLRPEITGMDRRATRAAALSEFGLDARRLTLLVTGGSLGARAVNRTIARSAHLVLGAGWQVMHIAGERSDVELPVLAGYRAVPYCDRMDLAFAAADLVLARAGSSTVSEVTALGLPAVYVPLPIGNGEQRLNARAAVRAGAAIVVEDSDFTEDWVADRLLPLLADRAELASMAARALAIGVPDGAERVVALIDEAVLMAEDTEDAADATDDTEDAAGAIDDTPFDDRREPQRDDQV